MKTFIRTTAMMAALVSSSAFAGDIAPITQALTLAQISNGQGQLETLLVVEDTELSIKAVNLSQLFDLYPDDPLSLVNTLGYDSIAAKEQSGTVADFPRQALAPAGGLGTAHIAAGTNYKAHGEEADIDEVFLFPKFSQPSPHLTQVVYSDDSLIDYEVELCMRWSGDLTAPQDTTKYDAGLFLCGDLTDRATLLRNIDVSDVTSGHGFTDAKSGDDRFPTGPYLVVPKNWQQFVPSINLTTSVNGEPCQASNTQAMIKDPQALVNWVLAVGNEPVWKQGEQSVPLIQAGVIRKDQALITGTPEGVVYRTPGSGYQAWKSLKWLATLSFFESGPVDYILEEYIAESLADKRYLQPGDRVQMSGTYLGTIAVDVVEHKS